MHELLSTSSVHAYTAALHTATAVVAERLRTVEHPFSGASAERLAALVDDVDLDAGGVGTDDALREIDALFLDNAIWFHLPAYTAHLNCPVAVPAVAAEAVLAAVNPSVDTYDQSTAGTLMERRLVRWTGERIGFTRADGVFTSGGTQSNLQALFLAREAELTRQGGERRDVLSRMVVLCTASTHFSVAKAALLLGLSDDAVVEVRADDAGRMSPGALALALDACATSGRVPFAVVATAGTTDRGVIDPLAAIADVCDAHGVWLHVDAAYGCGLLVSPTRRHLLAGIERSRSVTVDYHKSFFQPVSSSALIVRDGADLARGSWHADYLNPRESAEPNQVDKSLQTTRRFDALKLWTTLRALGADRLGEMFDRVIDLAAEVRGEVDADPELELVGTTQLSTVLFRAVPPGTDATVQDALVAAVRRVLFDSGRAIVAKTVIDGRPTLKLTLLNPQATLTDVRGVLDLVKEAAAALAALSGSPDDVLAAAGVRA